MARLRTVASLAVVPAAALGAVGGVSALAGSGPAAGAAAPPASGGAVLSYTLRSGLDEARSREAVFTLGPNELLVVGGLVGVTGAPAASAQTFDTVTGRSVAVGSIGQPLAEAAGVQLRGSDILLGGGGPGAAAGTVPATAPPILRASARTVRVELPGKPGGRVATSPLGSLPAPRSGAGAAVLGGRVYLAGGYSGDLDAAEVLSTTDGRHFDAVAQLAEPVRFAAVIADGGALFVIGGEAVESGVPEPVAAVQELLPGAHAARVVAELPEPVVAPEAWVAGGSLYVAGGDSQLSPTGAGTVTSDSVWSYDLRRHLVELAGELSLPVSHAGVAVLGDTAVLVGGELHGGAVATVQEVVPARTVRGAARRR